MNIFLTLLISSSLTWWITKLLIKPFKRLIPDLPNERSAHNQIKPRGGGISFISINFLLAIIFNQNNFVFLLPLSLISILDDFFNVSRSLRFITQILTACYLLFFSPYFELIMQIDYIAIRIIVFTLIVFGSAAIINFCNFMDGIDGILTGSILIILISFSLLISGNIWPLIGSLFGFLCWNWKPSKIFMGDIGSNFLGGVLVWTILNTENIKYSFGLILIASPILVDPLICLIRRFIQNQNIFKAHSLHLYQRLNKGGLDHAQISIIYILSSLGISIAFFLGGLFYGIFIAMCIYTFGFWLDKSKAIPFFEKS